MVSRRSRLWTLARRSAHQTSLALCIAFYVRQVGFEYRFDLRVARATGLTSDLLAVAARCWRQACHSIVLGSLTCPWSILWIFLVVHIILPDVRRS